MCARAPWHGRCDLSCGRFLLLWLPTREAIDRPVESRGATPYNRQARHCCLVPTQLNSALRGFEWQEWPRARLIQTYCLLS